MNVCVYCDECVPVLTHLGLILGNNISLSLPLSLCWLRAVRYLVLFPLLYTSHILSLITLASGKSAASRFSSGGGESFPAFSLLSFYFITAATSLPSSLLSTLSPPPSLRLERSLTNTITHTKARKKKITSSLSPYTRSSAAIFLAAFHFQPWVSCRRR